MTDEASGSSIRDARYWSTSAAASRGWAARVSIDSMTAVGMAETQAGVVDAAAKESRRASGSFSASETMEAGRSCRRAATSLWKAGLDSSVVMKFSASVKTFDTWGTGISDKATRCHALFRRVNAKVLTSASLIL